MLQQWGGLGEKKGHTGLRLLLLQQQHSGLLVSLKMLETEKLSKTASFSSLRRTCYYSTSRQEKGVKDNSCEMSREIGACVYYYYTYWLSFRHLIFMRDKRGERERATTEGGVFELHCNYRVGSRLWGWGPASHRPPYSSSSSLSFLL